MIDSTPSVNQFIDVTQVVEQDTNYRDSIYPLYIVLYLISSVLTLICFMDFDLWYLIEHDCNLGHCSYDSDSFLQKPLNNI